MIYSSAWGEPDIIVLLLCQVLNDLSLKISRGEKLALVGPSGSGKSSLIKVIQRLYDVQSGEVSVLYIYMGGAYYAPPLSLLRHLLIAITDLF